MESRPKHRILIVDDEPVIREVLQERLSGAGFACQTARNSAEALKQVRGNPFDVVLSDIAMPGGDGISLLRQIKLEQPDLDVVMLTGVIDVETAIRAIRLGASDYLTKPFNLEDVLLTIERTLEKRRLVRENLEYQLDLERKVEERTAELRHKSEEVERLYAELKVAFEKLNSTYETTLEALMEALDARDSETQGHSRRVAEYTAAVARRMGIDEPELTQFRWGALLHDVGKIGIPDAILRKPGPLTADEWTIMRQHPEMGRKILSSVRFLDGALPIVASHQERFDGTGYPRGLKGEEIPLGARIFTVVDCVDAMLMNRPYRLATTYDKVRAELMQHSGTQFDPRVVDVFLTIPPEEWQTINERVAGDLALRGLVGKD
ncbi:MAG TPA: HD domain-containing phosphohydrolase [Candidatus Saccharimonadales bacterium]|nr:HD domain-containing phosphohydrolase [Candidatus Saccharimonadales bacterium]